MSLDVYLHNPEEEIADKDELHGFETNITHNLIQMADAAGIYKVVWRPEEIGIEKASQLIKPLQNGIAKLRSDPAYFKQYDAWNGWGTYEQFIPWLEEYLAACITNPDAVISVSH